MSKIFEGDYDSDVEIKTNNEYAKNYDNWRKKEELNRLKTRYGEEVLQEETSSSSEDDDDGVELTEEIEKQFFKTLSCLKNKDPRIYDENVKFFDDPVDNSPKKDKKKTKKDKPLFINDYERELILQKNGEVSDNDEEDNERALENKSPTYVEEQRKIKESFKKLLNDITEEDDEEQWGGVLKVRQKSQEEKHKEEADYKEWLAGQKENLDDEEVATELKPLKEFWNNPKLDADEKFLRDYILQKRFLSKDDDDYIPTYDEIIHDSDKDLSEDEQAIEKQEDFEHKYNFRFEEPDQDFIKRYPRTVEQSLRRTDDKRKIKRVETKERKQKEKEQKMQELRKLQELKRQEIVDKIQKLKEITGNEDMEFKDEDLDGDFDPEAHDKRMQSLFNDDFYEGAEGDQKPEFPEFDEYLEIENWGNWKGENVEAAVNTPHCEDEDFNMDCDYDPTASTQNELIENSNGRKKRKRKSLFAKALDQPKPTFDPNDKTYEEYLDEYYKLDCEDIIGDIPCRFKYRKVVPNSFGLTVEEILNANDKELNKWCSLKKALQYRPDHVEKYDQIAFEKRAQNFELKKKLLPSLFESKKDSAPDDNQVVSNSIEKKKKTKIRCVKGEKSDTKSEKEALTSKDVSAKKNKKKKKKKAQNGATVEGKKEKATTKILENEEMGKIEDNVSAKKQKDTQENKEQGHVDNNKQHGENNSKKKGQKIAVGAAQNSVGMSKNLNGSHMKKVGKKRKRNSDKDAPSKKARMGFKEKTQDIGISDARLSAYGINPKKFKNKLKYKKT